MADRPPFRLKDVPTASINAGEKVVSPAKGVVFQHALAEGEPLYEAAREEGSAPDREVGAGPAKSAGKGQIGEHAFPDHPPAIPWPQPVQGVDHIPMKLKK